MSDVLDFDPKKRKNKLNNGGASNTVPPLNHLSTEEDREAFVEKFTTFYEKHFEQISVISSGAVFTIMQSVASKDEDIQKNCALVPRDLQAADQIFMIEAFMSLVMRTAGIHHPIHTYIDQHKSFLRKYPDDDFQDDDEPTTDQSS